MYKLLITAVCISVLAAPVSASAAAPNSATEHEVPVIFDALIMRPLGLVATAAGCAVWVLMAPISAMTRPSDMRKTFTSMVINPSRFTFVDPLGYHPDRLDGQQFGEIQ